MTLTEKIVQIARSYVGQKEKPNNSGFVSAILEAKMKLIGWIKGQAWCAYGAELIWHEAFKEMDSTGFSLVGKYFSGSAVQTYYNFKKSPEFAVRLTPKVGSVIIWRHGSGMLGHAGICIEVIDANTIKVVEGNTNASGGREGIEWAIKTRKINQPFTEKGLNYLGSIYPDRLNISKAA